MAIFHLHLFKKDSSFFFEDMNLYTADFGALAIGRKLLLDNPTQELAFFVSGAESSEKETIKESDLWKEALKNLSEEQIENTLFVFSRENEEILCFCKSVAKLENKAEKREKLSYKCFQLLRHIANEGKADSVEFRRLARNFFRNAKHLHFQTIFFLEAIFSEEKTKKILQQVAGSQTVIKTLSDIDIPLKEKTKKQKITIYTADSLEFTHQRAEEILRQKVSLSDIKKG